jgi:hypothetical protein
MLYLKNQQVALYPAFLCETGFVLIDLENINNIDFEQIPKIIPSTFYIIGFLSSNNHQYEMIDDIKEFMQVKVINSAVKDACDHLITFVAAQLCVSKSKSTQVMYIVTKDHIGSCIAQMVNENFLPAHHIVNLKELGKILSMPFNK